MSDSVLFEIRGATGFATLNRPEALNSLNLEMVDALHQQLTLWRSDPTIAAVILAGSGTRAFCAGGDVKAVALAPPDAGLEPARRFFAAEYQLDLLISEFEKPLSVFGHGLVFGGGWGLLDGAGLRILTETTVLSMPELLIGFIPDVGASYFLGRVPDGIGRFLALTGSRIQAQDALEIGLAEAVIPDDRLTALADRMVALRWNHVSALDRDLALRELRAFAAEPASQLKNKNGDSALQKNRALIATVMRATDLLQLANAIRKLATHPDPWLQTAAANLAKGSPTSFALTFEEFNRSRGLSRRECLEIEFRLALECCARPEFREGVRALLIDKDLKPRWNPQSLESVPPALVAEHFPTVT